MRYLILLLFLCGCEDIDFHYRYYDPPHFYSLSDGGNDMPDAYIPQIGDQCIEGIDNTSQVPASTSSTPIVCNGNHCGLICCDHHWHSIGENGGSYCGVCRVNVCPEATQCNYNVVWWPTDYCGPSLY